MICSFADSATHGLGRGLAPLSNLFVIWLLMRSSTSLLIAFVSGVVAQPCAATLPRGEQQVCKHQAASQEPKKQHRLRALHAKRCLSFWVEAA